MPFSETILRQAWIRSGGRCECTKHTHDHIGRCNRKLLELYRGDDETTYGWEAQSKSGSFKDLDDCEIVCLDCQEQMQYVKLLINQPFKAKKTSSENPVHGN